MKILRAIKGTVNRDYNGKFFFLVVGFLLLQSSLILTKVGLDFKQYRESAENRYWHVVELKSKQWLEVQEQCEKEKAEILSEEYPASEPYAETIIEVCNEEEVSPLWIARIIDCESNGRPDAVNRSSQATGLMQFMPSTWLTTPYAEENIFDPEMQIRAAAWMYKEGRQREWACN